MKSHGFKLIKLKEIILPKLPPEHEADVLQLMESVGKDGSRLLEPIGTDRKRDKRTGKRRVIWGRRRLHAFTRLGVAEIPTHLVTVKDEAEREELADIENAHRSSNAMEQKQAMARLADRRRAASPTDGDGTKGGRGHKSHTREVAEELGVDPRAVKKAEKEVARLTDEEQAALAAIGAGHKEISEAAERSGIARAGYIADLQLKAQQKAEAKAAPKPRQPEHPVPPAVAKQLAVIGPFIGPIRKLGARSAAVLVRLLGKKEPGEIEQLLTALDDLKTALLNACNGEAAQIIHHLGLDAIRNKLTPLKIDALRDVLRLLQELNVAAETRLPEGVCLSCKGQEAAVVGTSVDPERAALIAPLRGKHWPGRRACKACNRTGWSGAAERDRVEEVLRVEGDEAGVFIDGTYVLLSELVFAAVEQAA